MKIPPSGRFWPWLGCNPNHGNTMICGDHRERVANRETDHGLDQRHAARLHRAHFLDPLASLQSSRSVMGVWFPILCWRLAGFRTPHAALDSKRSPAVSGASGPMASVCWSFSSSAGLRIPGWLPKKSALSLAILRAAPSRIRKCPERNQKLPGQAMDPRWTPARIPGSTGKPVTGRGRWALQAEGHRAYPRAAGPVPSRAS